MGGPGGLHVYEVLIGYTCRSQRGSEGHGDRGCTRARQHNHPIHVVFGWQYLGQSSGGCPSPWGKSCPIRVRGTHPRRKNWQPRWRSTQALTMPSPGRFIRHWEASTMRGRYTAPASLSSWQGVTVTATSVADPDISAYVKVPWVSPRIAVQITPPGATLSAGRFTGPLSQRRERGLPREVDDHSGWNGHNQPGSNARSGHLAAERRWARISHRVSSLRRRPLL